MYPITQARNRQFRSFEIEGSGTTEEVRRFARMTRVPPGLRDAYVRFAMRTVVGVAPSISALSAGFSAAYLPPPTVTKIAGLPFTVASVIV